ncbi:unnamed protein product [Protopolystoma xenopodis]|uniref:Uncharacterized protein n=1 Tax=Protopolystoma xenopodis TaxID=117903 RepID=A0A448WL08_9PLAT|nr:unnamed protein product [Protopolystoma xenopodis]
MIDSGSVRKCVNSPNLASSPSGAYERRTGYRLVGHKLILQSGSTTPHEPFRSPHPAPRLSFSSHVDNQTDTCRPAGL